MDPPQALEGIATGRLRRGLRVASGVVPEEVYAALVRLQRTRRLRSRSEAVGFALTTWYREHGLETALKPGAVGGEAVEFSGKKPGLKPTGVTDTALAPWEEAQGETVSVVPEGGDLVLLLATAGGLCRLRLPRAATVHAELLVHGARVAVLRTDEPGRDFVVRLEV